MPNNPLHILLFFYFLASLGAVGSATVGSGQSAGGRQAGGSEQYEWFEVYTSGGQAQISNLQPGVSYEFRVGGTCNALTQLEQSYTYSSINTFTMPTADESVSYNCGIVPEINITNTTPLENIGVNETFTAGDFPVTVTAINPSPGGGWEGTGFIVVPYLADTKIAVEFSGIKINTDYQLFDGIIQTTYDADWGGVDDVGDFIDGIIDLISGLFDTNDAINTVYSDGVIEDDELEILTESEQSYLEVIEELKSINPRTEDQQELLESLQENSNNLSDLIEDVKKGNDTISQNSDAYQSQQAVNNLTKVTIYFNNEIEGYKLPNNAAFPTVSGVPIKLSAFDKLGINDYGGLDWFIINGVKYLGCYTTTNFKGYYPKTFLDTIQAESGEIILASKENLEAFKAVEYQEYTIAQIGEQVFTLAKRVEGDGATIDCICEYRWIVEETNTTVQQIVKDRIPPQNAIKSNCNGAACNTTIVAGALGSNVFDAITEAYPEIANDTERLAKLEELKNYLDELTTDKTFALYNTNELKVIGQNNLTEYRRYFKDNNIYSKTLFLEHFPKSTYARGVDVIFSEVDLRKNLKPNYNQNSTDYIRNDKYYYDFADLTTRYLILEDEPNVISAELVRLEEEGIANAVSVHNSYEQYVAKWGTNQAWMYIAQWAGIYAEDIIEGYGGAVVATKISRLFGKSVKTSSSWKKFLALFKKPQKVKNKALSTLSNNARAKQLVDKLADHPAFQGIYDNSGFKFKLPDASGNEFIDVIEVGYDGRIIIKEGQSIQGLDGFKIEFPEGTNLRVGNNSFTKGTVEVDGDGVVKFKSVNGGANIFSTLKTEINILSKQVKNHTILEAEYLTKYPGSTNYPYLTSAPVEDVVVSTKTQFVRLHDANNINREWMMSIDDFNEHIANGGTLDDIVEKLALPTRPTKISLVEIPANETIRKSIAGPQQWSGIPYQTGGYTQYQILGYSQSNPIPLNWYSQTTDLNSMFP